MGKNKFDKGRLVPYLSEFGEAKAKLIKSRLRLFCLLTLVIYITTSALGFILDHGEFQSIEIVTWILITAVAVLVLFLNQRSGTLREAKLNSALFAVAFVSAMTFEFFIYPQYASWGPAAFALIMFFTCFVIPWDIPGVIFNGVLNMLGYSAFYISCLLNKAIVAPDVSFVFSTKDYTDGLTFLSIALVLCLAIRRRDNDREKENFVLMKELEARNNQMEEELALARDVHKTLIPRSTSTDKANIAVSHVPVSTVGGDYATFHVTKDGDLFFLIGDITGHGISAALLVNRIYGEVENLIRQDCMPGKLLKELDQFVQRHFKQTRMYLSVCSGLLDFRKGILFYSNYGHPPQILHQHKDNNVCLLKSQTHLLGIGFDAVETKVFEGNLSFSHKDRIILFTDGLIEATDANKELYGIDRLSDFVKLHIDEHPTVFNNNLLEEVTAFRSGLPADDIFLLTIDIK
ncbi:MAG: PP2C family protein-serine/threonine phosphatase [Candidatus Omnitrophica bacterium]|nr:PP2C family protein-serine/threonine phosphatase [Candidatus Omnitrophota bacterium]